MKSSNPYSQILEDPAKVKQMAKTIFNKLDTNHDKVISYTEFYTAFKDTFPNSSKQENEKACKEFFDSIDQNNDKKITLEELEKNLKILLQMMK